MRVLILAALPLAVILASPEVSQGVSEGFEVASRSGVLTTDWDVPQFQKTRPRGSVAITRIDRAVRNFGNLMI